MKKIFLLVPILIFSSFTFSTEFVQEENKITDMQIEVIKDDIRNQIMEFAKNYLETPYKYGSTGPKNFDCSGFVNYIFSEIANINLPRVSSDISKYGKKIENEDDLKIGDLLFFKTTSKNRISHVGIYIGDNKFIHASSSKKKVVISEITGFYKKAYRWATDPFIK